jgi:hypothetical protein
LRRNLASADLAADPIRLRRVDGGPDSTWNATSAAHQLAYFELAAVCG